MIYYLKEIIDLVLQPLVIFWILISVFFALYFWRKVLRMRWLFVALVWLAMTTTRWIPDLLVRQLEKQFGPVDTNSISKVDSINILVLGSGNFLDPSLTPPDHLSVVSLYRLAEGLRLATIYPQSKILFSGYGSGPMTHAEYMSAAAVSLGLDTTRIGLLKTPRTTEEEALAYKQVYAPQPFILVTSDLHLPRAMMLFKKHGLTPYPAPAGSLLKKDERMHRHGWSSDWSNLYKLEVALHEYVGWLWGKMTPA